jgi:hypothetical protein
MELIVLLEAAGFWPPKHQEHAFLGFVLLLLGWRLTDFLSLQCAHCHLHRRKHVFLCALLLPCLIFHWRTW